MFQTPIDIANRALQRCGAPRILSFFDQSKGASEIQFNYDKLRRAELRRNLWTFATRKVALRALDTTSSLVNFEDWSATFSGGYPAGYVVTYGGLTWVSLVNANTATPGPSVATGSLAWDIYFGPATANAWNDAVQNPNATDNTAYHAGEIAYLLSTGAIYVSIVEGNANEPDVVDAWSDTVMYAAGAVVSYNNVHYQSLGARNFGNEPDTSPSFWTTSVTNPTVSGSWVQLSGASLSSAPIVYPLTAGPASDSFTRNAFRLPDGFLRVAPQDPKAGVNGWLGAHVGLPANDWVFEGQYLTTGSFCTSLMLRFIADVQDVTTFDDMFCEGLAARIAWEIAPTVSEAPGTASRCAVAYRTLMGEARTVDAIEAGPTEQDEDEYITVRL